MKMVGLSLLLLTSLGLLAQMPVEAFSSSTPNDSALLIADVRLPVSPQLHTLSAKPEPTTSTFTLATPLPVKASRKEAKVFDKKFLAVLGVTTALTVVDIQLTQRCLGAGTCREVNPMYGSNPTAARMYGISFGVLGGETLVSRWLRKRRPQSSAWALPLITTSAAHGAGAITGALR